ncbi:MAG TPA: FAD-dependent oxidoreductase [Acidimicrobiales bacterium]|nr:FAD-dependent oxidoreductase [Acidimicrobiales bacterium]
MNESAHRPTLGERVAELAGLPHRPGVRPSPVASPSRPPEETDVVVVGSGAAALSAAAGALSTGASVVVCEKGPVPGGTTACSGGVAHIYANSVMQAAGIADPRDRALAYMARCSHPGAYDPEAPRYGLLPADYAQLETYYDRGAEVMARLAEIDAVRMEAPWLAWDGQMFPDYYEFPENRAVRGRGIQAVAPDGGAGNGGELVRQLMAFAYRRGTEVRLEHRVVDLALEDGAVTGVVVDDGSACRTIRAHGGVVFGSGGFAHSPELRARFLRGPIAGGSGVPSNTGDLVGIGTRAGAQFGGMHKGWWNQQVLEAVDDYAHSVLDVWSVPGDSMVMVNRLGVRAVGEKREYESRGQVHHIFAGDEYINRVMFMVYDQRAADRYAGRYPIPPAGTVADHVVTGIGVAGLAEALRARLQRSKSAMPAGIAPVRLAPNFADTLAATIARFNAMAERGRDDDFDRGTKAVEHAFHGPRAAGNSLPNPLMYPLDAEGQLFAISLVGTTFDTNSGPRVGTEGQILGTAGPIGGLYGAGNCVDGVFGQGYPGGGSTIGPGMVFGFLGGAHAGHRSPRVGAGR